eukprot:1149111-Pelagomonas_calceolata.AAC.2
MNQADVLGLAKHVLLQLVCPRRQHAVDYAQMLTSNLVEPVMLKGFKVVGSFKAHSEQPNLLAEGLIPL